MCKYVGKKACFIFFKFFLEIFIFTLFCCHHSSATRSHHAAFETHFFVHQALVYIFCVCVCVGLRNISDNKRKLDKHTQPHPVHFCYNFLSLYVQSFIFTLPTSYLNSVSMRLLLWFSSFLFIQLPICASSSAWVSV